jgi:transglutaminase-like putative cysteine protease
MYDIRQFRPALYLLLILGITGFALASEQPGLWVLSVAAVLLNAWLVKHNLFRPLPRLMANVVTIAALAYVALIVRQAIATPILVVGQFLVLLQIVKLYEQRANRDYAQLIVLSLLLIVAASISTAKLSFGTLLVAYLFLALYVCLLFHLKVETDHAKQAIGISEDRINPTTLRQDQRYLARSMRRFTGFVSVIAVTMAIFVFLFFPRGTTGSLLGPLQFRPSQTLTGFSDQLQFQNVARIQQNPAVVAYVNVWRDEQPVQGTMPLLLRGKTVQVYHGKDAPPQRGGGGAGGFVGGGAGGGAWQWSRTARGEPPRDMRPGTATTFPNARMPAGAERWRQRVTLEPTGTPVLFALGGVTQIAPIGFEERVQYSADDLAIQVSDPLRQRVAYEVVSTNLLPDAGAPDEAPAPSRRRGGVLGASDDGNDTPDLSRDPDAADDQIGPRIRRGFRPPRVWRSNIDPRIEEFAHRADVSGADEAGPLAPRRARDQRVTPLDLPIATNVERYLRTNYLYTLDLTDAARAAGEDPMVAFLYDFKRGHCEYFAGAMTLLCQSLGMQARVVLGFKCDEYNDIGNYYVVRQSHAHAWVEVLGDDGFWHTFDPTGARSAPPPAPGMFARLRNLFNFMEFTWANSVIAYDRESRANVWRNTENTLINTISNSSDQVTRAKKWVSGGDPSGAIFFLGSKALTIMIYLMVAGLLGAIVWFFVEKWRLRRRARRIGLGALPPHDQLRLARQLGFYDDLLRLLERHRIYRPRHLTPMEFSQAVSFLPADAFHSIRRMTEIFYRVRFGKTELTPRQRTLLHRAIDDLEQSLRPQVPA